MGTYWAFVGFMGVMGLYYLLSAFVSMPDWLAPRRFPGVFGLVTAFLPERWGMIARRVLTAALCFVGAGAMALQALKVP
jgi:hypothetical protein